jgi:methionyl-tRNA synthetase
MGMDEHGQKVAQTAEARGWRRRRWSTRSRRRSSGVGAARRLVRPVHPHDGGVHKRGVRDLILRIHARDPDDFYERTYEGGYCVGCERSRRDDEIVDGRCAAPHAPARLDRGAQLVLPPLALPAVHRAPASRASRVSASPRAAATRSSASRAGARDVSASRARCLWGVPFPRRPSDGETQSTFVWFDALPNYLTATGFPRRATRPRDAGRRSST